MMRGTFGNIRIKNKLVSREGGFTVKNGDIMPFYGGYEISRREYPIGNFGR